MSKTKSTRLRFGISTVLIAALVAILVVQVSAYESKTTTISRFKTLCNNHPDQASYVSLGKTTLGKDIWVFRLGNANCKAVLWSAQLHGDEDMGSVIMYQIAKWLLESNSAMAKTILETTYVLFVPVVNVDSYQRTNVLHVNLNRNFKYQWGTCGSSNPSSSEYRGAYAASEKETQTMRGAFFRYKPRFYVDTHMWAGPKLFYYRGNTLMNSFRTKYSSLCTQYKQSMYYMCSMSGGGFAMGDAGYYYGANAFLLEFNAAGSTPSYTSVITTYYNKCLPLFIATCQT